MRGTDILNNYIDFVKRERREPVGYSNPTESQIEEQILKKKWCSCKAYKTYTKYKGVTLNEIPFNEREIVKAIREAWIEIDGTNVSDEVIAFVKKYKREPRKNIFGKGNYNREWTADEIEEVKLSERWERSFDKQVIDRMAGVDLNDIPRGYRSIVKKLRAADLGYAETLNTRLYIKFIKDHGVKPRQFIERDGRRIDTSEKTEEEAIETAIRNRWEFSDDKQIYLMYKEGTLDEETALKYKDMIASLDEAMKIYDEHKAKVSQERKEKRAERRRNKRRAESAEKKALKEKAKIEKAQAAEALIWEKQKKRNEERKKKLKAKEKEKARIKAKAKEIKEQREQERMRARLKEREERREERKEEAAAALAARRYEEAKKKEAAEHEAKLDKAELNIEIAKLFIEFIKEYHRIPRTAIRDKNGKEYRVNELTDEQKREKVLRRAWETTGFMEIVEAYAGTPIEQLPEEYRDVIASFRSEGFGLTWVEYESFRATRPAGEVLRCVKSARDMAANKKACAIKLEESVLEQLRARGKEKDNEQ